MNDYFRLSKYFIDLQSLNIAMLSKLTENNNISDVLFRLVDSGVEFTIT